MQTALLQMEQRLNARMDHMHNSLSGQISDLDRRVARLESSLDRSQDPGHGCWGTHPVDDPFPDSTPNAAVAVRVAAAAWSSTSSPCLSPCLSTKAFGGE